MKEGKKYGQDNIFNVKTVTEAFKNIKDEIFGSEFHKSELEEPESKSYQNGEPKSKFDKEHEALVAFIDKFCTCSLKDPRTRDIVRTVNMHNHTKTCQKYMVECRFWFPRFF